jgi:hypothetical protein
LKKHVERIVGKKVVIQDSFHMKCDTEFLRNWQIIVEKDGWAEPDILAKRLQDRMTDA